MATRVESTRIGLDLPIQIPEISETEIGKSEIKTIFKKRQSTISRDVSHERRRDRTDGRKRTASQCGRYPVDGRQARHCFASPWIFQRREGFWITFLDNQSESGASQVQQYSAPVARLVCSQGSQDAVGATPNPGMFPRGSKEIVVATNCLNAVPTKL